MLTNQNNLQDGENDHLASRGQAKAMEGEGMGGHNFGKGGKLTPMGDDCDNPSRNAGYSNAYFARVAPMDEDTANNNFKAAYQQGEPDYDNAQKPTNTPAQTETPDQQRSGDGDSHQETQQENYHEPELDEPQPDHGAAGTEIGGEKEHIET